MRLEVTFDELNTGRSEMYAELAQRQAQAADNVDDAAANTVAFTAPLAQLDGIATCVRTLTAGR